MIIDLRLIARLDTCRGLDLEQATSFLQECEAHSLAQGAELPPAGTGGRLVLVRDGRLEQLVTDQGQRLVLRALVRGDHVGGCELLGHSPQRGIVLRAQRPSAVLTLGAEAFGRMRRAGHPVVYNIEHDVLAALAREVDARISVLGRFCGGHSPPPPPLGLGPALRSLLRAVTPREPAPHTETTQDPLLQRRLGLAKTAADALIQELGDKVEVVEVSRGEALTVEGSTADMVYVLHRGQVGRYRRSQVSGHVLLGTLKLGDLAGFEPLLMGGAHRVSTIPLTPATVLKLPRDLFRRAMVERSTQAALARHAMIASLASWQDQAAHQLLQAAGPTRAQGSHPHQQSA